MRASFASEMNRQAKDNAMQEDNAPMASNQKKLKQKDDKKRAINRENMKRKRALKLDPDTSAAKTLCEEYMGHDIPAAPPARDIKKKSARLITLLLGLIAPGWAPTLLQ